MTQKIVIEVQVKSEKCRRKAFKIAAVEPGVSSVALEGEDRNQVVVIGDCVDSVCLANALRRKFCHAKILRVEEVKLKPKEDDKKKEETKLKELTLPPYYYPPCPSYVVCDHQYGSTCIIM